MASLNDREPTDPDVEKGALVLLVGDGRVNDGIFDALVVDGVTEQLREYTYCAEAGEGVDKEMACFTDTAPSVVLRHSGADKPVFTLSELAAQTAAFQAGLGGGGPTAEPEREPGPEPTEPWRPSTEVDWENYASEVKARIDRLGRKGDCEGLQEEFDTAYENDERQRSRTGDDGNADLMGYIQEWLDHAEC